MKLPVKSSAIKIAVILLLIFIAAAILYGTFSPSKQENYTANKMKAAIEKYISNKILPPYTEKQIADIVDIIMSHMDQTGSQPESEKDLLTLLNRISAELKQKNYLLDKDIQILLDLIQSDFIDRTKLINNQISMLETKISNTGNTIINNTEKNLSRLMELVNGLTKDLNNVRKLLDSSTQSLTEADRKNTDLIVLVDEKLQNTIQNLESTNHEIQDVRVLISELKKNMYQSIQDHMSLVQGSIQNIRADLTTINEEIAAITKHITNLQLQDTVLQENIDKAIQLIQVSDTNITDINTEINTLQQTLEANTADLKVLIQNLEQLTQERITALEADMQKDLSKLESLTQEGFAKSDADIILLNSYITQLQITLETDKLELKQLLSESENLLQTDITAVNDRLNQEITLLSNRIKQNEDQLAILKASLDQTIADHAGTKSTLQTALGDLGKLTTRMDTAEGELEKCFLSVSDGKSKLASAITDKGIKTDAAATFDEMALNIRGLVTMSANPNVLFNITSWTAPENCIANMSFSVSMEANCNDPQVATVTLNGVKQWQFGWGDNSSSDTSWHTYGTSGNITWEAKKGQTYSLSFDPGCRHYLTWGWGPTTWIVPKTSKERSKTVPDNYFYQNAANAQEESENRKSEDKTAEDVPAESPTLEEESSSAMETEETTTPSTEPEDTGQTQEADESVSTE